MVKKSRVKLFPNLSNDQVNLELQGWRNLQNWFVYYYDLKYIKSNPEIVKQTIKSTNHLVNNPYKNPRMELKRWNELYKSIRAPLGIAKRKACTSGRKYIDQAKDLYKHKIVNVVQESKYFKASGYLNVNVVSGLTTSSNVWNRTKVFIQRPGDASPVEVTDQLNISSSPY
jgi:hypothetical protein